jgi:hypothetical protein
MSPPPPDVCARALHARTDAPSRVDRVAECHVDVRAERAHVADRSEAREERRSRIAHAGQRLLRARSPQERRVIDGPCLVLVQTDQMRVAVDEPRHHGRARQIDHAAAFVPAFVGRDRVDPFASHPDDLRAASLARTDVDHRSGPDQRDVVGHPPKDSRPVGDART